MAAAVVVALAEGAVLTRAMVSPLDRVTTSRATAATTRDLTAALAPTAREDTAATVNRSQEDTVLRPLTRALAAVTIIPVSPTALEATAAAAAVSRPPT